MKQFIRNRNAPLLVLSLMITFCSAKDSCAQASDDHPVTVSIPVITLLDLEPDNSGISLSVDSPTEAGLPPSTAGATDNSKWINYSSCITPAGVSRRITAQVIGTVPPGITLTLQASAFSGAGGGSVGASAGSINLSTTPQQIISGIGGAYTGNGSGNGHQLNYQLEISNISSLTSVNSSTAIITFTIVE